MRPNFVCPIFVLFLLFSHAVLQADTPNAWLRGAGNQLEMRLRGEVLDAVGHAAIGVVVSGSVYSPEGAHAIETKVDGSRFEAWVPLNQRKLYSVSFKASLNGDEQFAFKRFSAFELRQAAIDGIKLSLQVPTRQVRLKVTDAGKPVSGANLKAELNHGTELRSKSDENGIVMLNLLPAQALTQLTAWTDDFRIGGYGFDRTPARDPKEEEHVVELSLCRNLKMRFVDQSGEAVPNVSFVLYVATPTPNYNYIGQTHPTRMQTDSNGEALYRWFPDWKAHHFYGESKSDLWYVDQEKEVQDDVVVFKMTRSKIADRKRVSGTVRSSTTDVGGFLVSVQTFQADREGYSDHLSTFTNADGTFSVDVLPDATYCVFSVDPKWVSNITDLIPYQSTTDKITSPELTLSKGQQVEVFVITGPDRKPFSNLAVSFSTKHRYSWFEGKEKRNGSGGPSWWATTDAAGRIQTPANLGKLDVSVYTPLWQTRETHDVSLGQPTKITLHREIEAKRTVQVQLILQDGLEAKLDDAAIVIGALGGSSRDHQTLSSDSYGTFSFETLASPVAVFARTKDGRAAGSIMLMDQKGSGKLLLRRTLDFVGQLIGEDGKPSVGVRVVARVRVEGKQDNEDNPYAGSGFEAMSLEAVTDQHGKYTIAGLPSEMKVSLSAVIPSTSEKTEYFGEVWLEENESRPTRVNRIGDANPVATTLAARFEKNLRDSIILGFPLMVILSDKSKSVADFVNANFVDYESKPEVASYLQFVVPRDKANLNASDADFFKEHNWQIPVEGRVTAFVLDGTGNLIGRLEVDVTETEAGEKVAAFVSKHLPAKLDAQKKWQEAFADAKRTNRKVWARLSGRYCGPCFLLARWLDDHREILDKDYVMLKIDEYADENGVDVAKRITRGGRFGIPFFAIFDKDELLVVDSDSPLGNIGFPSGYEGSKHLRKMLLASRGSLTDAEVEQLVASLADE